MSKTDYLDKLGNKEIHPEDLIIEVRQNLKMLPRIIDGVSSSNANIKFGCAKILRAISSEKPEKLYQEMDLFIELLDSPNNIIKWNAVDIVANLTKVDKENKFDEIFEKFYGMLSEKSMVTAAHVIDNSGKIARVKPHLTDKITDELLKVENIPRTQECKNILMGKTILAFGSYFEQIEDKDEVILFVKKRLKNSRNATKVKAEKFMKKYGKIR